jgi:hypothetical protein
MHPESPDLGLGFPKAGQNLGLAWLGVGPYDGGGRVGAADFGMLLASATS